MAGIFSRPVLRSPELTERASNFFTIAWMVLAINLVVLAGAVAAQPGLALFFAGILAQNLALTLLCLELNRRGHVSVAAWFYALTLVAFATIRSFHAGGIYSTGMYSLYLFPLMTGLLLSFRAGVITAFICAGLELVIALLQMRGVIAKTLVYSPISVWMIDALYMGVGLMILRLAIKSTVESNQRLRQELAERIKAEQQRDVALEAGAIGIWEGDMGHDFMLDARGFAISGMQNVPGKLTTQQWIGLIHPDDTEKVAAVISQLQSHADRISADYRIVRPDGGVRHVEVTAAAVERDGQRSFVGTVIDVTERRALEDRLHHSRKMEAIGTLAGGIAHDFNNILGAVQGFASLLEETAEADSRERGFAQRIGAACERGRDIVKQILSFARHGAQQRDVIDLVQFVSDYAALLAKVMPATVELDIALDAAPIPVRANAGQLSQLIANLCKNAAESFGGHPGTVRLDISSASLAEVTTAIHRANHVIGAAPFDSRYARLRVSDLGAGIEPKLLPQIFDPFFSTKGQRGTGLGLAVVHGVVEAHGGFCTVETVLGRGTAISVYFPLAAEPLQQAAALMPAPDARGHERILIVDDEPDITDSLALNLDWLGYDVLTVNDPHEAMEIIHGENGIDAIVADHSMPGMSGIEVIREFKRLHPDGVAILVSGYSDRDPGQAMDAIDLFLDKPVKAAELAARLRILFERAKDPV
ncbi:MAG TPA: ATP-binding protein [Rhizomicrobium sp.]|nr:ATP-binding protein [Rhizomicrobium sp.]